jgi:membrane dipeptidase
MFLVDAHLDLSYNAMRGRNVIGPAADQPVVEGETATVGLPDLRRGDVGLVCATIFCLPSLDGQPGYANATQAAAEGWKHIDWYRQQEQAGHFRFVTTSAELPDPSIARAPAAPLPAILLLEGADPILDADDVPNWHRAGIRIVGLSWRRTRYAGGTGAPGPLTPTGVQLVRALDQVGMIHDASHLAEQSFWQLLDLTPGPLIASHSNCRALVATDRQLSDEMIRAIAARDGVIGINFFDRFLIPSTEPARRRATLGDVLRHVRHIADLLGHCRSIGLGTDMDGGLGREQIPQEIATSADLPRVADALSAGGFADADVKGILGGNWLRFFHSHLPGPR